MYIPNHFKEQDKGNIIAFMQRFSFASIINIQEGIPIATPLPFVIEERDNEIILISHFARANEQWKYLGQGTTLVLFSEPHAYISPAHYDHEQNVPTWNYVTVHAYGKARIMEDENDKLHILEKTIQSFEPGYAAQWNRLPEKFRNGLLHGIVAFEITVTDMQAKSKLSQNRSKEERQRIMDALADSEHTNEKLISEYMNKIK